MSLKDWAKRKNQELHRQALEDRDSKLWHSHAFHRYFEGYTEYKELDRNGKEHMRRIYTSSWYTQDLSRRQAIFLRVCFVLLFLIMCCTVVTAGMLQGRAGTAFYIVLPELATLLALLLLGYTILVNYLFAPKKMTVHDYRVSSGTVKQASMALIFAFGADAAMTLLEAVLRGTDSFINFWIVLIAFMMGCLCSVVMHMTEKKVPYREIENSQADSPQGTVIESR